MVLRMVVTWQWSCLKEEMLHLHDRLLRLRRGLVVEGPEVGGLVVVLRRWRTLNLLQDLLRGLGAGSSSPRGDAFLCLW